MLKIFRFEISIILILFLYIFFSKTLELGLDKYHLILKNVFQQTHIKEFFENITILGDSLWYFIISILLISIFYLFIKNNFLNKYNNYFKKIQYYNFILFLSVLVSGIITQIIKHIVGRPRPGVENNTDEFQLNFFTFDSNFHSYPSGHSSTVFAVALVLILMFPKLKYFFYFLAIIISFSRIVVGAHFITDIIGGMAVAFIGFKIAKLTLNKFYNSKNNSYALLMLNSSFQLSIIIILFLSIIVSIGPTLDIFISNIFYLGEKQFIIQSYYFITILFRKILIVLILFYILILPFFSNFALIKKIYFGYFFKTKSMIYVWLISIFNLLLIINFILKNFWGRARPNEILELGGMNLFTPWYKFSTQCDTNCSFVSGDAAVGFSLIIFYFLVKNNIYLYLSLLFGFAIGLVRIMEGAHFFSDVLFSCLIVFIFNYIFYLYYSKKIHE